MWVDGLAGELTCQIPRTPSDPPPVSREFAHLPVHELIKQFARFRDTGDERMHAVWEALVVKTFDRVHQSVKSFTFPGGQRLSEDQRKDAAQEAYVRVQDMAATFQGTSEGEYRAALAKCVWFACMDFGRSELRHEKGIGGSLDEPAFDDAGDRGRFDEALERDASRRGAELLDKLEQEARAQRARGLVAWAIAQVENEKHRTVLELTLIHKLDGNAIAERLSISTDNVFARRSRGLKRLEAILRDRRP